LQSFLFIKAYFRIFNIQSDSSCKAFQVSVYPLLTFRVSHKNIVKTADFGLAKDLHSIDHYRRDEQRNTAIPVKWLAMEIFQEGKFSTESDIVSFHVSSTYNSVCLFYVNDKLTWIRPQSCRHSDKNLHRM